MITATSSKQLRAQRLLRLRTRLNMTQRELAAMLGVTSAAIALWEGQRRALPPAMAITLDRIEDSLNRGMFAPHMWSRTTDVSERFAQLLLGSVPRAPLGIDASMFTVLSAQVADVLSNEAIIAGETRDALWFAPCTETAAHAALPEFKESIWRNTIEQQLGRANAGQMKVALAPVRRRTNSQTHQATLRQGQRMRVTVPRDRMFGDAEGNIDFDALMANLGVGGWSKLLRARFVRRNDMDAVRAAHRRATDVRVEGLRLATLQAGSSRVLVCEEVEGTPLAKYLEMAPQADKNHALQVLCNATMALLKQGVALDANPASFVVQGKTVCLQDATALGLLSPEDHTRVTQWLNGDNATLRRVRRCFAGECSFSRDDWAAWCDDFTSLLSESLAVANDTAVSELILNAFGLFWLACSSGATMTLGVVCEHLQQMAA